MPISQIQFSHIDRPSIEICDHRVEVVASSQLSGTLALNFKCRHEPTLNDLLALKEAFLKKKYELIDKWKDSVVYWLTHAPTSRDSGVPAVERSGCILRLCACFGVGRPKDVTAFMEKKFDCNGESTSVGVRWSDGNERLYIWKRPTLIKT
ncbi:hypothetical protein EVAR_94913_1 [Eumeta japonica]|uniref:Uncharacterized protein n=1 Tax=Eumeta variegata TaxID=151549 RepID=A0A4C1Z841_EUMVA|nr:hypothetical protein EVAR_94913_1 [Eumeta japonica]